MKNKLIKFLKFAKEYLFGGALSRAIIKLERVNKNPISDKEEEVAAISNILYKESTIKKYGNRPAAVYREFTVHKDLPRLLDALKSINAPAAYNLNNVKSELDVSIIELARPKLGLRTNGESVHVVDMRAKADVEPTPEEKINGLIKNFKLKSDSYLKRTNSRHGERDNIGG